MESTFFGLPVEILDQIFFDAISVRTCLRTVRLRLVCRESFSCSTNTNILAPLSLMTLELGLPERLRAGDWLTFKIGTFDYYITKAMLQGHILDEAFKTRYLSPHSMRSRNAPDNSGFGKPTWLPLISYQVRITTDIQDRCGEPRLARCASRGSSPTSV